MRSQRRHDQAVIQAGLNAILGPDYPASEMWAAMARENDANMLADDLLPGPELFESKVVYAYAGTLPPLKQVELGMKIIGAAHGIETSADC
jgi:hypothetical protein